jgi:predicted metal-dependent phosphoesterase TrpH
MNTLSPFHGARWWKFDFHSHTPASADYGRGQPDARQVTPIDWLREFMVNGIDCVAVTDHNSGGWIDLLQIALHQLEADKPEWFRPLHLFPGVEISVLGGTHVIGLFDIGTPGATISSLLGECGYRGNPGDTDYCTTRGLPQVECGR